MKRTFAEYILPQRESALLANFAAIGAMWVDLMVRPDTMPLRQHQVRENLERATGIMLATYDPDGDGDSTWSWADWNALNEKLRKIHRAAWPNGPHFHGSADSPLRRVQ